MKKFKKISIYIISFFILLSPLLAYGLDSVSPNQPIKIDNPFKGGDNLFDLITAILNNIIMPIAAVFVVVWIIYAGFQFVMAQGKPADIEKAKQNLLWSLIGAGILLGSAGISTVVQNTIKSLMN